MKLYTATLSQTVQLRSPATHVFDCLTDWPVQSQWMVGTSVQATKQSGKGVGAEISAYTGIGFFGFTDTMIITAWDPPRLCSVKHTGRIVKGTGDFVVTSISPQTSTFTWSEDFILPFGIFGKIAWPVTKPFVRLGLTVSLERFARWAEQKPAYRR